MPLDSRNQSRFLREPALGPARHQRDVCHWRERCTCAGKRRCRSRVLLFLEIIPMEGGGGKKVDMMMSVDLTNVQISASFIL